MPLPKTGQRGIYRGLVLLACQHPPRLQLGSGSRSSSAAPPAPLHYLPYTNRTTSRTTGQERSQPVTASPTSSHRQSAHVSLLVLASCATGPYHSYVVLSNRAIVGRLVVLSFGNRSSTGSTTGLTMRLLGSNRRKYPRLPTTGPSRTTELVVGNRRF